MVNCCTKLVGGAAGYNSPFGTLRAPQRMERPASYPSHPDSRMSAKIWTAANGIMLALFVFSAVVQFNDPDPLVWVAVYGAAAAVCWLEVRRRAKVWQPLALSLLAFGWAGILASRAYDVPIAALFAEWEMKDLRVEEAREMYGLTIVGIWMMLITIVRAVRAPGKRDLSESGPGR